MAEELLQDIYDEYDKLVTTSGCSCFGEYLEKKYESAASRQEFSYKIKALLNRVAHDAPSVPLMQVGLCCFMFGWNQVDMSLSAVARARLIVKPGATV